MGDKFKIIIVGGSIAGLTLAHCLSRLEIDYVVLEKRREIAPQEGASVGIMPNGGRILEQLGLYDQVEKCVEPLRTAHMVYPDGFRCQSEFPRRLCERFGFPLAFLDRQKLLEILYSSLPDAEKIKRNCAVVCVENQGDRVGVQCVDGSFYEGNLIVGADGVHSIVRTEMWKLAQSPGAEHPQESTDDMTVEYACIFGISSGHPYLSPGQQISCFNDGWSILAVVGKNRRTFWFLFLKMDHKYTYGNAPRFSSEEAVSHCERLSGSPFWKTITFGDVWTRCEKFSMTSLEEVVFCQWFCQRIVCIGDSMHKFAPNIGQGANCAIEDAAELANTLHGLLHSLQSNLSPRDLKRALDSFADKRCGRLKPLYKASRLAIRLQARNGPVLRFLGRYILPHMGDKPADWASRDIADGPTLVFLPQPRRSGPGWVAFRSQANKLGRRSIARTILLVVMAICCGGLVRHLQGRDYLPLKG